MYSSFLSCVKKEYEDNLLRYKVKVQKLDPLESKLATIEQKCNAKIFESNVEFDRKLALMEEEVNEAKSEALRCRSNEEGLKKRIYDLQAQLEEAKEKECQAVETQATLTKGRLLLW